MSIEAPFVDDGDRYVFDKANWVVESVKIGYPQGVRLGDNGLPFAIDEHGFEVGLDDVVLSFAEVADEGEGYYPNIAIASAFLLGLSMKGRENG